MTVASTTSRASYAGNGSTTTFTVPFYFLANTHLQVIKRAVSGIETTLTLTTDYTVSGAGVSGGGSVTCLVPPLAGETLVILRNVPFTQEVDYQSNDPFPAQTHEQALDKLTMELQQLNEVVSRAVTTTAGDSILPSQLISQISSQAAISQAAYQGFIGTYYGSSAVYPTLDPLGNAITIGDLFFFTPTQALQVYTSTGWQSAASATPTSYSSQLFNGTGAQTAFTLSSAPAALQAVEVYISGVRQRPTTDYTLAGTTLTFLSAPASGTNNIFVRWTASIAVGTPNDGSVTTAKIQDFAVTTAKVADQAITYAKMQNVSATQRLHGRNTAGAGAVEEVTLSQLLDWIGSAAQGDILYRDASGWARLAAGTAGNVLTTNGPAANPSWSASSGGWIGSGQTWQDVTASRAAGTIYTNSTGKPIQVSVIVVGTGGAQGSITLNGTVTAVSSIIEAVNATHQFTFIIPNSQTYLVTLSAGSIQKWVELR